MNKRALIFSNGSYVEYADITGIDLDGVHTVTLPSSYRHYSTRGKSVVTLSASPSATIAIDSGSALLERGLLTVTEGDFYLNGSKLTLGEHALQVGDRIFASSVELLYEDDHIGISGQARCSLNEYVETSTMPEDFPEYTRSPRIIKREPTTSFELKSPQKPEKQKKGELLKLILPPLGMAVMATVLSIVIGRGIMMLMMVGGTLVTLVVSVTNFVQNKKDAKQEKAAREEAYTTYLLGARKELARLQGSFIESRNYHFPTLKTIETMVEKYSPRIYERRLSDADFLQVSLGYADTTPSFKLSAQTDETEASEDPLLDEMKEVYANFQTVTGVPVVVDLKNAHLGIVGKPEHVREQLKAPMASLAFFQSYHDIEIITLSSNDAKNVFDFARWLPHSKIKNINVSGLITSENQRDQVLGTLAQVLKMRKQKQDEAKQESLFSPHYVFVIEEPKSIINHSIMEYLQSMELDLGFSLIYTTNFLANLPENIKTVLMVDSDSVGTLLMNEGVLAHTKLRLHNTEGINFENMARTLAPLKHNQGVTSNIPESITFFEMYGVEHAHDLPIARLWEENASFKSLSVPLGARGEGDIVSLNLHEKAHGPHGLVAGTTGSGKSEVVQSYILSLAVNFHPSEVGFLLIDYKGGGMANLFKDLPHLLGTITNLDGSESMRALASIQSELKRRQHIFGTLDINNINDYTRLFKQGKVKDPMPHLFIISDEFAELKKEQPEFMKELVSAARIGRSLGIKLILATQKPSGVVDDQIWSNSKFKLALKVQNEGDSNEVLKTPDAARITQPGRAILQVGNNEIYEMFQTAWSGAEYSEEKAEATLDERIYLVNALGQGELLNQDLSFEESTSAAIVTELDATVAEIKRAYESIPAAPVEKPWLPPLGERIINPSIPKTEEVKDVSTFDVLDLSAALGIVDIPETQSQVEFSHDFSKDGNLALFSAPGFGKSTFLTNLALTLSLKNSPENLHYYVLDLGNSALIPLKGLPHTADYLSFDDTDKLSKLWKLLIDTVALRKKLFARESAISFAMYNTVAKEKLPAIVFFIDNYDVVKELGPECEEILTKLSRDGAGVGIYIVLTATRPNAMRFAVLNNFKTKIANFMFDASEIHAAVGRSAYTLPELKGRGAVKLKDVCIMQHFLPSSASDEVEYANDIRDLVSAISASSSAKSAPAIPILPEVLLLPDLLARKKEADAGIAVGLDAESIEVGLLGKDADKVLILGGAGTGKTTMLKTIIEQVVASSNEAELLIADSLSADLYDFAQSDRVTYMGQATDAESFIERLKAISETRKELLAKEGTAMRPRDFYASLALVALVIDDVDLFIASCGGGFAQDFEKTLEEALMCGVRLYAASLSSKLRGTDNVSKMFKGAQYGIVKGVPSEQMIFTAVRAPHTFRPQIDRAFFVTPRGVSLIMTPVI